MNQLTIKSSCVEAQFKRSRTRNKGPQHTEPNSEEHPLAREPKAAQSPDAELCIAAPPHRLRLALPNRRSD